jgi:hypothetical protein
VYPYFLLCDPGDPDGESRVGLDRSKSLVPTKPTAEQAPKSRMTLIKTLYILEGVAMFAVEEVETHIGFFKLASGSLVE